METSQTSEEVTVTSSTEVTTLTSTVTRITFSSRPSEFSSGLESLREMVREIGQQLETAPALQYEEFSKQEDKLKVSYNQVIVVTFMEILLTGLLVTYTGLLVRTKLLSTGTNY